MAERTEGSITVSAPPASVLAVIADFPAYPDWAGQIRTAEVLGTDPDGRPATVAFTLDAGLFRDSYVLDYDWAEPAAVSWHLVRGDVQRRQDGRYELTDNRDGTTSVRYQLAVELSVPLPGLLKRRAEQVVVDTALTGLKRRVESLPS